MTEESAERKLIKTFPNVEIRESIKVSSGFVLLLIGGIQPIFVSDNDIHGLNGNRREDARILNEVASTLKNG